MTLLFTASASGQDGLLSGLRLPTDAASLASAAGITGNAADIKKVLRGELSEAITGLIESLFREVRTSIGLPAEPTDPTSDPMALLEYLITSMVSNSLTQ